MTTQENKPQKKNVKCPQCGRLSVYSPDNKFRPFCSERCKIIDLGQWADEAFKIPVEKTPDSSENEIPDDDPENYE
jgi:endogenous inhibitor of DNA gyrase (YacG/DUF329 family)